MVELKRYDYAVQRLLPSLWLRGFDFSERGDPQPGDLVMLQSAPQSEWHLSWYVRHEGGDKHLLESLKTGELCNWSNVGFVIMSRTWVSDNVRIKWTDKQFAFEKMFQAEFRKAAFYMEIPYIDHFDGDSVFITFRTRFAITDILTPTDPFNIDGASRANLRCHLLKWQSTHKKHHDDAVQARKSAA